MKPIHKKHRCRCGESFPVNIITNPTSVTCPGCQKKYDLRAPARQKERGAVSMPVPQKGRMNCPFCAEKVSPTAQSCPHCNEPLRRQRRNVPKNEYIIRMEKKGTTALILGIVGLVLCTVFSPFAWFYAHQKEKQCHKLRVPVPGNMRAGTILGIIGTVILMLYLFTHAIAAILYYRMGGF